MFAETVKWSKPAQWIATGLFIAAIILPLLDSYFHFAPRYVLEENRKLEEIPHFAGWHEWKKFPARFEAGYNDRFGFREALVKWDSWLKVFVLRESPTTRALIGKDGWLYYTASLSDYRGLVRISRADLTDWQRELEAKSAYLASRGVRYLFVIVPDKETIYPEYLPGRIVKVRDLKRADQLFASFEKNHANFEWLDLRPTLKAAKDHGQLFQAADSHWNDLGAQFAAEEIIQRLRQWYPDIPILREKDYKRVVINRGGGDLARMMGFPATFRENYLDLQPKEPVLKPATIPWQAEQKWDKNQIPKAYETALPDRRHRAILSTDSFGPVLLPLLAASFQRTVLLPGRQPSDTDFDTYLPRLLDLEKPDVFVELVVERNVAHAPKLNPRFTRLLGKAKQP